MGRVMSEWWTNDEFVMKSTHTTDMHCRCHAYWVTQVFRKKTALSLRYPLAVLLNVVMNEWWMSNEWIIIEWSANVHTQPIVCTLGFSSSLHWNRTRRRSALWSEASSGQCICSHLRSDTDRPWRPLTMMVVMSDISTPLAPICLFVNVSNKIQNMCRALICM